MKNNLILKDIPDSFETKRLLIKIPRAGEGEAFVQAMKESYHRLKPWFPWAQEVPTIEESEIRLRESYAKFLARDDFLLHLHLKADNTIIGSSGLHPRDWNVPSFEIGYWIRTGYEGKGYISEAVQAITKYGFETLEAKKIIIRMQSHNKRSEAVAKNAGYQYEGTHRNYERATSGKLADMTFYGLTNSGYENLEK